MPTKSHSIAIDISGEIINHYYVYVMPGVAAYSNWYTVRKPAADKPSLEEAQQWLEENIGYRAEEREIHHRKL